MKLSFRGIQYESHPSTIEVVEGRVGGLYRGSPWKLHQPKQTPKRIAQRQMTYRGVRYQG